MGGIGAGADDGGDGVGDMNVADVQRGERESMEGSGIRQLLEV